ncbi:hypothetical protein [Coprobacter sp.]
MKAKLTYLTGFLVLIGIILNGIFGIAFALLLSGIIGITTGIYKKDKTIWQPFAIIFIINILCIITFTTLLHNSNM